MEENNINNEDSYGDIPKGFEHCGCCGNFHKIGYYGDCRNDSERYIYDDNEEKDVLISVLNFNNKKEKNA